MRDFEFSRDRVVDVGGTAARLVVGVVVGLFLMTHNTRLVSEDEAPKSWQDPLDPKWRNKLAVGHPGFSGAIGVWAVQMRKMYGWDYFKKLERNNPQIGRSSQDPVTTLNADGTNSEHALRAGDGATTMATDGAGRVLVADTRGDELLVYGVRPLILRQRYPVPDAPYGGILKAP